ncbi:uncharacterized protein V6R79_011884 [Siganus canaliculatus]
MVQINTVTLYTESKGLKTADSTERRSKTPRNRNQRPAAASSADDRLTLFTSGSAAECIKLHSEKDAAAAGSRVQDPGSRVQLNLFHTNRLRQNRTTCREKSRHGVDTTTCRTASGSSSEYKNNVI